MPIPSPRPARVPPLSAHLHTFGTHTEREYDEQKEQEQTCSKIHEGFSLRQYHTHNNATATRQYPEDIHHAGRQGRMAHRVSYMQDAQEITLTYRIPLKLHLLKINAQKGNICRCAFAFLSVSYILPLPFAEINQYRGLRISKTSSASLRRG